MRIALISIASEGAEPVRLAGRPIAWHQMHRALAQGCERVICLAEAPSADLAALQQSAERTGAAFHAVAHHRALSGLVSAADTLLVFASGVMPEGDWMSRALAGRNGIATFGADGAAERGFERIDRDRAWAGVLATRGDAVESLAALPPDADPIAGLLRIALQRGTPPVPVSEAALTEERWALLRGPGDTERFQPAWYQREVTAPPMSHPLDTSAYRVARALTNRGANSRTLFYGLIGAAGAFATAGAGAGYRGYTALGLASLALAALLSATALAADRFTRAGTGKPQPTWAPELRNSILEAGLVAIAISPVAFGGWKSAFAATVLVAGARFAQEDDAPVPARPFADRSLLLAILAGFAAIDRFAGAAALLGLAALGLRLFWPKRRG